MLTFEKISLSLSLSLSLVLTIETIKKHSGAKEKIDLRCTKKFQTEMEF